MGAATFCGGGLHSTYVDCCFAACEVGHKGKFLLKRRKMRIANECEAALGRGGYPLWGGAPLHIRGQLLRNIGYWKRKHF